MASPFRPKKHLGQHFLADTNLAAKIVASLDAPPDVPILEIGPGTGALTRFLLQHYSQVMAVEVDDRAVAHLQAHFPDLHVWQGDVLKLDFEALARDSGDKLHVIGNLPYYCSGPIVLSLLAHRDVIHQALLMVQWEVAQRMVASCGNKQYGIPSVLTQLYASVEVLFKVSPEVFVPKPAVESAIIRLQFCKDERADVDPALLREVVRAGFGQRRKMLRNSLQRWTRDAGMVLPEAWARMRAEDLSPEGFVALTRHIQTLEGARSAAHDPTNAF